MAVSQRDIDTRETDRKTATLERAERARRSESRTTKKPRRPAGPRVAAATHTILRVGAGLLFWMHGMPKLFGWFGGMGPQGGSAELFSLMGLAGVLEVFGGILITLGLLTRPVAIVLALEMLVAYFMSHAPRGAIPYENGGELALLYMVVWIFLAGNGAGPWSVDAAIRDRRSA